jgi:hypothetical protein
MSVMRHRLTLLLVALLPALIAPAGTLRFCLCDSQPTAPECCCKTKCCDDMDRGARIAAVSHCPGCQELTTPKRNAAEVSKDASKQILPRLALTTSTLRAFVLPVVAVPAATQNLPRGLSPTLAPPLRI